MVNQHGGGAVHGRRNFLDINHRAIGDAPDRVQPGAAFEFDIVGGVSTGALLATHALLGTPADDAQLEEMYTQITKKDIYKERGIFSLAFGADSLSDTAPLRELIAKFITAETLKRVAAAYDDNR